MNKLELRSVLSLSSIFALRMMAVFALVPVFTSYASTLSGVTPMLLGIAVGIYGLVQAIFQLPLGVLSDTKGRKYIATLGMLFFLIGSLLAAFSTNINYIILARILQGMGAIGSTLIALLADLTLDKNRTKAMAVMGISMGLASAIAIILGPWAANHGGLKEVFLWSAVFTFLSIIILNFITPNPTHISSISVSWTKLVRTGLKDKILYPWHMSIFLLHVLFTAMFYAVPLLLKPLLPHAIPFYLWVLAISFFFLLPSIGWAERKKKTKEAFIFSIFVMLSAQIGLYFFHETRMQFGVSLILFFMGFNFLEALLPSIISRLASTKTRGTAMSIYSCSQFLGIFVGGIVAGCLDTIFGLESIFIFTGCLGAIWLFGGFKKAHLL